MKSPIAAFAIALLLGSTTVAQARTWHVERDGSGEFIVIQDAINAASSGDTIQIGPGTYPEYSWAWNNTQYDVYSCAHATQSQLTIIGSGIGVTIIGGFDPDDPADVEITGVSKVNSGQLNVQDLSIIGLNDGMSFEFAAAEVANCEIVNSRRMGVFNWGPADFSIINCRIVNSLNTGIAFTTRVTNGTIRNCNFENNSRAVYIDHGRDMLLENCTIRGGAVGIDFVLGAVGTIRGCRFADQELLALGVNTSFVDIYDNFFGRAKWGIRYDGGLCGSLRGSNNIIEGCEETTIEINTRADTSVIELHGNHILNGGGLTVSCTGGIDTCPSYCMIDMSDNFWGTEDASQISQWIDDYYDYPPDNWLHHALVIYEPFSNVELRTEHATWGSLKSLFR